MIDFILAEYHYLLQNMFSLIPEDLLSNTKHDKSMISLKYFNGVESR